MRIETYTVNMFDDRRESRRYKILAHRLFPRADWWLYLDWNIRLTVPVESLPRLADVMAFQHPFHNCAYAEHAMCARMRKDDLDVMRLQMDRYRREKYPENNGQIECGFLLRRNCGVVREFNELWWQEVDNGSCRDQLSVGYAAWKAGVMLGRFPGALRDGSLCHVSA